MAHVNTPTYLVVGSRTATRAHVVQFLQQRLCSQQGCTTCTVCIQIHAQQHPETLWIAPEKIYTKEQLAPVFSSLAFMQEGNRPFFCIMQDADYLTPLCANSLLKALEEPPAHYYFILTTERLDALLPTIRSRSIVYSTDTIVSTPASDGQLHTFFMQTALPATYRSTSIVKQEMASLTEHELRNFLENLIITYHEAIKNALTNEHSTDELFRRMEILEKQLEKPIMPGSSKLILQTLAMQFFF